MEILIIKELNELGWKYIEDLNDDLSVIVLNFQDLDQCHHLVKLYFNKNIGKEEVLKTDIYSLSVTIEADLAWSIIPNRSDGVINFHEGLLKKIKLEFDNGVFKYRQYLQVVRDLHKECYVIQPDSLKYSYLFRRIMLDDTNAIEFKLDPIHPNQISKVQFYANGVISKERGIKMYNNLHLWVSANSIKDNLESVLQLKLPLPIQHSSSIVIQNCFDCEEKECGICYSTSYHPIDLNENIQKSEKIDQTTIITCVNVKCNRIYHSLCLLDWLKAVPTNKISFGHVYGKCLYCQEGIAAKLYCRP
eukprot:gene5536-7654_t